MFRSYTLPATAIALLSFLRADAQQCGTRPPTPQQYAFARDVIAHIDVEQLRNAGTTCIPLQVHIVRRADGTGGPTQLDMNLGLSYLNHYYLPAGIEFFWKGPANVVNNDDYFTYDQTAPDSDTEAGLVGLFTSATDAVNVYYVDYIKTSSGFVAGGYAYFPANTASSNRMVIRTDQVVGSPTGVFIHEMGHFFNLFHTFEGTSNGPASANAENVPRTGVQANCSTKGDLLCDTDADPGANPNDLDGCTYTGTATDINGVTYTPPVNNPMSYWGSPCEEGFSGQQYTRIMQGLITRQGHNTYSLNAAPQTVTAASALAAVQNVNVVQLSWTDNAGNDMGYLIERSTLSASSGFEAIVGGATAASATSWTDADVTSNTTYWYRVKAANGNCNTYSNVAQVNVGLAYCTPSYFQTCAGGTNVIIDQFQFVGNTTINNSDSNCSPDGYGNFTAQNANVTAGSTYNVLISALVGAGSYFPSEGQIWLDANHDGDFNDSGEKLLTTAGAMGPTFTGSVTIPANAVNGATRLRVRCWDDFNGCDPDACSFCAFGETEDYTVTVSGGVSPSISLSLRAFLQGPFATSNMNDGLRSLGLVPLVEPYTGLGYAHIGGGGETTTSGVLAVTGTTAIVDWVVVELRNASTPGTRVATRSALLRRDGQVVGTDGTSPVTFNVSSGNYYVAVRHRNHMGCMTAAPVTFGGAGGTVDLTSANTATYGTDARYFTVDNIGMLWAGNVVGDAEVKYTGLDNDRDPILVAIGGTVPTDVITGYRAEDVNMDGSVKYTGLDNDRDPILTIIGGTTPTNTRAQQLP